MQHWFCDGFFLVGLCSTTKQPLKCCSLLLHGLKPAKAFRCSKAKHSAQWRDLPWNPVLFSCPWLWLFLSITLHKPSTKVELRLFFCWVEFSALKFFLLAMMENEWQQNCHLKPWDLLLGSRFRVSILMLVVPYFQTVLSSFSMVQLNFFTWSLRRKGLEKFET